MVERALAVPGVASATLAKDWPFYVSLSRTMAIDGRDSGAAGSGHITLTGIASPGYLRGVGIPLAPRPGFQPFGHQGIAPCRHRK